MAEVISAGNELDREARKRAFMRANGIDPDQPIYIDPRVVPTPVAADSQNWKPTYERVPAGQRARGIDYKFDEPWHMGDNDPTSQLGYNGRAVSGYGYRSGLPVGAASAPIPTAAPGALPGAVHGDLGGTLHFHGTHSTGLYDPGLYHSDRSPWAMFTAALSRDPLTGNVRVTNLRGYNSPRPYVLPGGPAPFGSFSGPLLGTMMMSLAMSGIGPRELKYTPPAAGGGGGGGGGGGLGGGMPDFGDKKDETPGATADTTSPAAETPSFPVGKPVEGRKALLPGTVPGDRGVDTPTIEDRIRQTALHEWGGKGLSHGGYDPDLYDQVMKTPVDVLAQRLHDKGYTLDDVTQAEVDKMDDAEWNRSRKYSYVKKSGRNTEQFDKERGTAARIYNDFKQRGYSAEEARRATMNFVNQYFQNRALSMQVEEDITKLENGGQKPSGGIIGDFLGWLASQDPFGLKKR